MLETKRHLDTSELKKPEIIRLFKEFCDFCLLQKGYSTETIRTYQYSFTTLLKYFRLTKIQEINEEILRQFFYRGRKEKNWTESAIIHHRKNLSPFFSWCVEHGDLPFNPFQNIEKPRCNSKIPEFYTDLEIEKILYTVQETHYYSPFLKKRNYAMIALFLMTGVRKSELLGLKLTDVNLEESFLVVRSGTSKSKRDRMIPLSQRLKDILSSYLAERKKLDKTTLSLFASYNRNMGFTKNGLKHLLFCLQQATGIHIYAHKFRHTFATKSLESNMHVNTVKEILGHKDIKTTAIYYHTTVKHLKDEMEKLKINCLI